MSNQTIASSGRSNLLKELNLEGHPYDRLLLLATLALLCIGLVMIASTSITIASKFEGEPLFYLFRQGGYVTLALICALLVSQIPVDSWQRFGPYLLILSMVLLLVLLIPGIGKTVNGSTRWLAFGSVNLQVSEFAKLALILYLAGYLVRHNSAVRETAGGFLKPMGLVALLIVPLLAQPDYGASMVLVAVALGMMFLGGVRLWLFALLLSITVALFAVLAITSPYRMERLTAFLDPWADPFNSGFQLVQALIAFGRGEWFGVGLGASVQKLFYLPEAHTDFVFAVLAEELGLVGSMTVTALFTLLVVRILIIGKRAAQVGHHYGSHLCYGIGLWLALQVAINIGVNMGLLPTKGLTLPLMSYGGSSMMVNCIAIAFVLRVGFECRHLKPSPEQRNKPRRVLRAAEGLS